MDTTKVGTFLAHLSVVGTDKDTTKTRIVFDASVKKDEISVNDLIHDTRLLTLISWVNQFIQNSLSVKEQQNVGQLSPTEMADAEVDTIKLSRKEYFKQKYEDLQRGNCVSTSSKFASLSPELNNDGLIGCNGQLKYAGFLP